MDICKEKLEETIKILKQHFLEDDINNLANVELPKEIKYKSVEWIYYIFYSCLLDYGMRSKIYHNNLINTYHSNPLIFNPKYVVSNFNDNQDLLFKIIKENIHPRYPNVALSKWLKLSEYLIKYDNLLDTIKSFKSFEELNSFVKSISGYGQKTGGLLLRLIYEANVCNFNDDISLIPLDRHDIEISYLNGIIESKNLNKKQIADLSNAYVAISNKLNVSATEVDKYLWEIGNRFCNKNNCSDCPLHDNCKTKISLEKEKIYE